MSEWAELRNQIQQGADWRGTVNVPVGDETFEITYRLLTESERQSLLPRIDMKSLVEHREEGQSDAEEVVEDLQSADDLSEAEEEQLQEAQMDLARQRADLIDALGAETFEAIRDAGRIGIVPDEEDVSQVMEEPIAESRERFGPIDDVPDAPETRAEAREAVVAEMDHWLEQSPYPVKFTVGQEVFAATQGEGNSSDESSELHETVGV